MRIKITGWLLILALVASATNPFISLAGIRNEAPETQRDSKKKPSLKAEGRALVIYSGDEKGEAYVQADKIRYYLQHFQLEADMVKSSKYSDNLAGSYQWIFYLGGKQEKLNKPLIEDLTRNDKPVVFMNKNLEQIDNNFLKDKGISIEERKLSSSQIYYKDVLLPKSDTALTNVRVTKPDKVVIYARAVLSKYKKSAYIVKSDKFWYIADNPLSKAREGSSYLAFLDILHNIVKDHEQHRKAVIRVDNINPNSNPGKLQTIVDFLWFSKVPFAMSVTPVYKKSEKSKAVYLSQKKDLIKVIKDGQEKGGVVILNGYTHQRVKETGTDIEFGNVAEQGKKLPEDKLGTEKRVQLAIKEMEKSGFDPKVWQTPYYRATPEDYKIFSKYFKFVFERGTEPPSPFIIEKNSQGQKVVPENLGYVAYNKTPLKETIPERAWRMQVVRDTYAGFSIQDSISTEQLVKIINKVKGMGYTFISPYQMLDLKYTPPREPFFMDQALYSASTRTENVLSNVGWAILPAIFFTYYLAIFGLSRRMRPRAPKENNDLFFVFIVPALNEGQVIRKTLEKLVALPQDNYRVLAMNDSSDDNTKDEILKVKSDKLQLYTTRPPQSRKGKGNVLNIAYHLIQNDKALMDSYKPENIIFSVVDSDGGVDDQILPSVTPYFEGSNSASVQVAVKIENKDKNIWTKWQDFEFSVFTFLFQSAREQLGSVGLGGNGQFIRLSALKTQGDAPWTSCLTEDLDIGIRLILDGWRNHFCPTTFVYQQGVPQFKALVKQRTRWFQGHVQCWRHLGRVAINRMPILAKMDITYYLLSISLALIIVPANFFMAFQAGWLAVNPDLFRFISTIFGTKIFFYWYFVYFGALPIFIYSYWKSKKISFIKAFFLTHLFLFVSVVWLIAGYIALFRMFRKATDWHKTARYVDLQETDSPA